MTVEIICVGTELLLGNIVNTNAAFLAEQCAGLGLSCFYQSVVGDNRGRLQDMVKQAAQRSDIVIFSGGLGPTQDDLTKETVAEAMGRCLVPDEHSRKRIRQYFIKRGMELTENNWKQADVPAGSIVLDNDNGTAPGIIVEDGNCRMILLPGPPNELKPMFLDKVRPYLEKLEPGIIYSETVKVCGISESKVETMISDLIAAQENPTIAPYAKTAEVHLRVTARAEDAQTAKRLIRPVTEQLKKRFGTDIYAMQEEITLEQAVVDLLAGHHMTMTTAESCTGGMIAARLINVPGVSDYYRCGYVTYANKAKRKLLGVKKKTLKREGAVSRQTAKEMAKGAARAARAEVAVAVTGIAGPDGGTPQKPVGLVYIGCYVAGRTTVKEFRFSGNRAKIRETTVANALILVRNCILKYGSGQSDTSKKS